MLKEVKSEVQSRTLEDVKREYSHTAFRAGDLNYQIYTLQNEIKMLNERMTDLNLEGAKLQAEVTKVEESKNE